MLSVPAAAGAAGEGTAAAGEAEDKDNEVLMASGGKE